MDIASWDTFGKIAIALAAAGTVAAFVLTPFAGRLYVWLFEHSQHEIKACIDLWYKDVRAQHDEMLAKTESLDLRFEAHVRRQAERDGELFSQFREMMEQQNSTLKAIHDEAQETAKSVAHIYGILEKEPWDGHDRRRGDRRTD